MNRRIAPQTQQIDVLKIPDIQSFSLDNGLKVFGVYSAHDVLKVDFVFDAGKWYEEKNLVADFTNQLIREGTRNKTSLEINEMLDFYGANLECQSYFSNAGYQLYALSKNVPKLLPLIQELFTEAVFPAHEVDLYKSNRKEKHLQRLAKTDYAANRIFLQNMWGKNHPYGRVTEVDDIEVIHPDLLSAYYRQHYNASNCFIILSGKFDETIIKQLNDLFGNKKWTGQKTTERQHQREAKIELDTFQDKENSVQCSLMVGNASISKDNPEFDELTVVNTLLGGYFGSRLMANIREEKGYTYGIYSSLTAYKHGGIFEISTDIGKEYREATLREIQKEILSIQTELVDEDELQTVKNYMSGKILRSVDGALRFSDVLKGLLLFDRKPESLSDYLKTIQQISRERVAELAQKHLDFGKMYKVAVG